MAHTRPAPGNYIGLLQELCDSLNLPRPVYLSHFYEEVWYSCCFALHSASCLYSATSKTASKQLAAFHLLTDHVDDE